MKILSIVTFTLILYAAGTAHAEKIDDCIDDPNNFGYVKHPCVVTDKEEAEITLHTMLLQDHVALNRVRKSGLDNPSFDKYRVISLGEKVKSGCGPNTARFRSVYKIQILVQTKDHGPTNGQEPRVLTSYMNELSGGYSGMTKFQSKIKSSDSWSDNIDEAPGIESDDPTEAMLSEDMHSPCKKK